MTKRALLIGMNYRGKPHETYSNIRNVYTLEETLVCRHGYSDVTIMTDDTARGPTLDNVSIGLQRLTRQTNPGDTAVIYISSLGTQTPTGILTLDDKSFTYDVIRVHLSNFAKGSYVIVFLEDCLPPNDMLRYKFVDESFPLFHLGSEPVVDKCPITFTTARVEDEDILFEDVPEDDFECVFQPPAVPELVVAPGAAPVEPPRRVETAVPSPAVMVRQTRLRMGVRYPTVAQGYLPINRNPERMTRLRRIPELKRQPVIPSAKVTIPVIVTTRSVTEPKQEVVLYSQIKKEVKKPRFEYIPNDWEGRYEAKEVSSKRMSADVVAISGVRNAVVNELLYTKEAVKLKDLLKNIACTYRSNGYNIDGVSISLGNDLQTIDENLHL
jgi:hypothetical protein